MSFRCSRIAAIRKYAFVLFCLIFLSLINIKGVSAVTTLAMIGETPYTSLWNAYEAANDDDYIQMLAGNIYEALTMDRDINVTLTGSYNPDFITDSEQLTVMGTLTIVTGSVTMDEVVVSTLPYSINRIWVPGQQEVRLMAGNHHFMTAILKDNGELIFRPHPGMDVNGWGSSWYAQPFLPDAVLGHSVVSSVSADSGGIAINATGKVSWLLSQTYGSWGLVMGFNYDADLMKISGSGEYLISLDANLSDSTGDLNLYKITSNYLDNVPLLSGDIGDTGDMAEVNITGNGFNFLWVPPDIPGYYPNDISDYICVEVVGQYNNVDASALGQNPIAAAYKPGIIVALASHYSGIDMIFGGQYDTGQSQNIYADNVGITPLVLKHSLDRNFGFDVTFESQASE